MSEVIINAPMEALRPPSDAVDAWSEWWARRSTRLATSRECIAKASKLILGSRSMDAHRRRTRTWRGLMEQLLIGKPSLAAPETSHA